MASPAAAPLIESASSELTGVVPSKTGSYTNTSLPAPPEPTVSDGGLGNDVFVYETVFDGTTPVNSDDADSIVGFAAGDAIELAATNPFATGPGDIVAGALAENKIAVSNNGTDTTIIFDLDTGAGTEGLTVTLVGSALTEADFTFDSVTDELTLF